MPKPHGNYEWDANGVLCIVKKNGTRKYDINDEMGNETCAGCGEEEDFGLETCAECGEHHWAVYRGWLFCSTECADQTREYDEIDGISSEDESEDEDEDESEDEDE